MKATLALENGIWYEGEAAGAPGETGGEVVFNTSMTGYQEILTDPSYAGQIVAMTAPEMGNYGVAHNDPESRGTQVAGFIVREESPIASNWRSEGTLRDYLTRNNIVAISNIDNAAHIGGLLTGLWIGALWPPTNIETTSSLWQRDRAEVTRLASVALVVPILVVGVVALAVVLGIAVGSPRFLA